MPQGKASEGENALRVLWNAIQVCDAVFPVDATLTNRPQRMRLTFAIGELNPQLLGQELGLRD
jgi:hypothetical protein